MSTLETNIFPILNLFQLSSRYKLYRIRGLSIEQDEYEQNIQTLIRKLSFSLRSPVLVILQNNEPHLVLQEGTINPPSPLQLVRATAYFDPTDQLLTLDYKNPTPETESMCLRFLQFEIDGALYNNERFWQPAAGHPFFERQPINNADGICIYRGYAIRVIPIDIGKFGLCIDIQHKYISEAPLPKKISRENFRPYKHARCVYHYGRQWYEIKIHDHTGLSINEQLITEGAQKPISLYQYIMEHVQKPLPHEVINIDPTSAAISYLTMRNEVRWAAADLCYPIYETSDPRISHAHRQTILPPETRRTLIRTFVKSNLTDLHFKNVAIQISDNSLTIPKDIMIPPDLAFGNETVFSVRGTNGATYVSLNQLGQSRLAALFDHSIGTYVNRPLDRQYLIIPQSIYDSYGLVFLKDFKNIVNDIYPQEIAFDPVLIIYNDLGPKTFAFQGRAILEAVDEVRREPGFGIVMIHETVDRNRRQHDQLASMVMLELRRRNLFAAVIHSTIPSEYYQLTPEGTSYQPPLDRKKRGRFQGYLRNVAITKVLLTNERWPFVLATPLHADLTISIDVQLHTACFMFIGKRGPDIRTIQETSNSKERLSRTLVKDVLLNVLREEARLGRRNIESIVIQRDGNLFSSEMKGVKEAIDILKKEGVIEDKATLAFVEIHKTSKAPFRLFEVDKLPGERELIQNPCVGSYAILNNKDGYICSTGREFSRPGTSNPLHIRYLEGAMQFRDVIEDIYYLTCLAWTRPEDCTRYPITLKLPDIRLRENAGGYDEDALVYNDEIEDEEEPNE